MWASSLVFSAISRTQHGAFAINYRWLRGSFALSIHFLRYMRFLDTVLTESQEYGKLPALIESENISLRHKV